jgi:glutamine synthetase type III
VAPSQYEIAPVFESANLANNHQQLIMITLKRVAEKVRHVVPHAREAIRGHLDLPRRPAHRRVRANQEGGANSSLKKAMMEVGVDVLPPMPKDAGDRNRTSPFAFTGNRFEFRAVGSNQSIADPLL